MPDLLLELFCEEIPARMQSRAAGDLRKLVTDALAGSGLAYEGAKQYATPRRLVLDVRGVTPRSEDIREEKKGPRTDAPQQAIDGFLRAAGLAAVDEAQVKSDPKKGDFYVAVIEKPGRDAGDIIAEFMPGLVRNFPWAKSMRWGENSARPGSLKWVRPLHSILCLFGPETETAEIIPFEIDGIKSGDTTRGHRFMAPDAFVVKNFDDYRAKLEKAFVMLDPEQRMQTIRAEAENLAFAQGLELVEDEKLLAEVAGLVEWPTVLIGEFDAAYLELPSPVIQLTIRENQKCFVLQKDGALTSKFILVSNIVASDGGRQITHGNSRVVNARLADAKFFWESDLAVVIGKDGFEPWIKKLDSVTFHAKLGTQGERVKRIMALAEELAPLVGADAKKAKQAAQLCKADLNSAVVYEFPEMQGLIGRVYAGRAGMDDSVALAMEQHYKPLGPTDDVPDDPVAVTVALADKLDTLTGFWAIDEKPTGSKDPFALRRAALGVIRLVLENSVRLSLRIITSQAHRLEFTQRLQKLSKAKMQLSVEDLGNSFFARALTSPGASKKVFGEIIGKLNDRFEEKLAPQEDEIHIIADLLSFFHDRLKVYLRDKGIRHDVIDAVITSESDDLLLISQKATALQKLVETDDGENLIQGYKRAANILAAEEKKGAVIGSEIDTKLLKVDSELQLNQTLNDIESRTAQAIEKEDYSAAMIIMATMREPVDSFFDNVMVNDDDKAIRANRLALLARIRAVTATVADFSKISG